MLLETTEMTKQLNRFQRFREALALLQLDWIPNNISETFTETEDTFKPIEEFDSKKVGNSY